MEIVERKANMTDSRIVIQYDMEGHEFNARGYQKAITLFTKTRRNITTGIEKGDKVWSMVYGDGEVIWGSGNFYPNPYIHVEFKQVAKEADKPPEVKARGTRPADKSPSSEFRSIELED